jgi:hypothetical protein
MKKRRLVTGQRRGTYIVLQEIQRVYPGGYYRVIVYCTACKNVKAIGKNNFTAPFHVTCGCWRRGVRADEVFGRSCGGRPRTRFAGYNKYTAERFKRGRSF